MAVQVSVVVPVFNAAEYVRRAVESALQQPETAEVILVEDASPDGSLAVCRDLVAAHGRVRLLRHPDGGHHGAGATRNLGIRNSVGEYVAFLDADDFFLPGRFVVAGDLLESDPALDGVYEAVVNRVEDKAAMRRWLAAGRSPDPLITVTAKVVPEQLLALLARDGGGYLHLNGLTVRRKIFDQTGLFDEHLRLHQDTAFFWKMAAVARLAAGRLDEPVAIRRIHDRSRISAPRSSSDIRRAHRLLWATLWRWVRTRADADRQQIVADRLLNHALSGVGCGRYCRGPMLGLRIRVRLVLLAAHCPSIARHPSFWPLFLPHLKIGR